MFAASYALVWTLVVVQGVIILSLVHQVADLKRFSPSHSLRPNSGQKAPHFTATDLQTGLQTSIREFVQMRVVLCFLSSECYECRRLGEQLAMEPAELLGNLVLLCHGNRTEVTQRFASASAKVRTLYGTDFGVYGADGFPAAFALDGAGRIGTVLDQVNLHSLKAMLSIERLPDALKAASLQ